MEKRIKRRGLLLILSSPSGAGKTSVARALLEHDINIQLSISVTTRPKRTNERHGIDYYFVNEAEFERLKEENAFIEYANVFNFQYGTLKKEINKIINNEKDVILDIDWQGSQQIYHVMKKDLVSIFILPPSLQELEKRLQGRGQDNKETVKNRMEKAKSEISHWDEYDYVLINKDLQETIQKVVVILNAERLKRYRQITLPEFTKHMLG